MLLKRRSYNPQVVRIREAESLQVHHVGAKSAPLIIPTRKGGDFSYRSLAPPFQTTTAVLGRGLILTSPLDGKVVSSPWYSKEITAGSAVVFRLTALIPQRDCGKSAPAPYVPAAH